MHFYVHVNVCSSTCYTPHQLVRSVREAVFAGSEPRVSLPLTRMSLRLAVGLSAWLIGFMACWQLGSQYLWALESLKMS